MKNQFEAFLDDLKTAHGKNLASVIFYGSAAAGDFMPEPADYRLLVALRRITPEDLRRSNAVMREWTRLGFHVPVYFTVDEIRTASDVFPIEFHNMERSRLVLFGEDVLADLEISDRFLRHQTEYELRSKLIRLRRAYIPASASVEGLTRLMAESLASFASLFRAVLRLKGVEPPVQKHRVVALTAQELGLDGKPFEKIFNIREDNFAEKLDEVSANELFAGYLEQIEAVIAAVDELDKKS
ncbi:MAG: hypothetical protein JSS81_03800 [Acidobacteria bacterium]|nr:hypothetical protein [Acidobacteriota bacterium]